MKKIIIALVVLAVVGIGAYYLVFNKSSYTYTPSVSNTDGTSSVAVDIKNFLFNPSTLSIKNGTKVTWVNNDSVSHTITSDSGNLLNSPNLASGKSFSFTFTNAGIVNYHCSIHPMMKGSVVVTN